MRLPLALLLALLLAVSDVAAQEPVIQPEPGMTASVDTALPSTGALWVGGVAGGLVGGLAGALALGALEVATSPNCFEYCGLAGGFVGLAAGGALGAATGAWLANEKQGSIAVSALAGAGVVAIWFLLAESLPSDFSGDAHVYAVAVPVASIWAVTETLKSSDPRRH